MTTAALEPAGGLHEAWSFEARQALAYSVRGLGPECCLTGPRVRSLSAYLARPALGAYYASPLDVQEHAHLLGAVRGPRSWAPVRDGPAYTACLLPGDVAAALSQGTCVVTVLVFPEARTVVFRT